MSCWYDMVQQPELGPILLSPLLCFEVVRYDVVCTRLRKGDVFFCLSCCCNQSTKGEACTHPRTSRQGCVHVRSETLTSRTFICSLPPLKSSEIRHRSRAIQMGRSGNFDESSKPYILHHQAVSTHPTSPIKPISFHHVHVVHFWSKLFA
jgi:hypothetical protein